MQEGSRLAILYGSQTGNAEDMAKRIGWRAKQLGYPVLVETMDDFSLKSLPKERVVVFVCSTTGHGQEPENMKNLYNFMRRRDLPKDCLSDLNFSIYGLGDSSYAKFNYVSKILYKRLRECGANPLQELVAGDEQHRLGCDGIIYPKLDELWARINDCDLVASKRLAENIGSDRNSYRVKLYPVNGGPETTSIFTDEFSRKYDIKESVCFVNERLTAPDHFQDTRFLCFKSVTDIHYEPGDVCTIFPENCEENIEKLMQLLNLDPKQRFKIDKKDANYMVNYLYDFIPDGLRVEDLVRCYLDIQSVPKRSFFEHLWPFSDDQLEREKLKEFASTEGQVDVYDYCIRPKRTILETLMDFPNTVKNVKLESLFDMIPPIKPRSFSIASSCRVHPNEIHLIVGVVNYKTSMRRARRGLCSNFLARMTPVGDSTRGSRLRYFIRRSTFKLPKDEQTPIIMIGPGLGIAPFRAFIEERTSGSEACDPRDCRRAELRLYFGCRHGDKDFYFRQELESYALSGSLHLRVAFSRQQPKSYVQDLLVADGERIARLIRNKGAVVYVAGNSKLPEELRSLLGKLLSSPTGDETNQEESGRIVSQLEATNRLQYDCW